MKEKIINEILVILNNINEEREPERKFEVSELSILVGADSVLDSLELVSLVVEAEQTLTDLLGEEVSLTDDMAMSQETPPFQTPIAIYEYLVKRKA